MDGQCILNVQLHQFQNRYNVEIRPENPRGQYCCCDQGNDTCRQNFFTTNCTSDEFCDTWEPYSTTLLSDVLTNTSTSTDVIYNFQFPLSDVPSEPVRVCAIGLGHSKLHLSFPSSPIYTPYNITQSAVAFVCMCWQLLIQLTRGSLELQNTHLYHPTIKENARKREKAER